MMDVTATPLKVLLLHPQKNTFVLGASIKDDRSLGRGCCSNADKSRQGDGGGFAVSGHPFHRGLCKREGIFRSFYHHLPVLKIEI